MIKPSAPLRDLTSGTELESLGIFLFSVHEITIIYTMLLSHSSNTILTHVVYMA